MQTLFFDKTTDGLISDLLSKEAVLWINGSLGTGSTFSSKLAKLIELPWRAVMIENLDSNLVSEIQNSAGDGAWVSVRGYLHIIASDPSKLKLPRRSQPIYFLSGNPDSTDPQESVSLPERSALRRRFNMVEHMIENAQPRRIFIVGDQPDSVLEDLKDLWERGQNLSITVVDQDRNHEKAFREYFHANIGVTAISWIAVIPEIFVNDVIERTQALLQTDDLNVRIKLPAIRALEVNLSDSELPERPISEFCDFVPARDLFHIGPKDLKEEEVKDFFTAGKLSWRPYAAGLPWEGDAPAVKDVLTTLEQLLYDNSGSPPPVFTVYSEPGAGGTTLARQIAFAAAQSGYLPVLAKQHLPAPSALELTGFMYRALGVISRSAGLVDALTPDQEPVWLVILDVEHFDREPGELFHFYTDLARSGRKFVLLKLFDPHHPSEFPREIEEYELANIVHNVDHELIRGLGVHLNRFLKPHGRDKTIDSWINFWERTRPDIDNGLASFWIALQFWLGGYLELGQSIQQWILTQFKEAKAELAVKRAIIEIAVLSIERRSLPELLLPKREKLALPWHVALNDFRSTAPGLGCITVRAPDIGNVWAFAHDVLARYLINGVYSDILLCKKLELPETSDTVEFRLSILEAICSRNLIQEAAFRPLVLSFATSILKLDEQNGNTEFFRYWKKVLRILDGIPKLVRQESRTFNHHLAISRRRIVQSEYLDVTLPEQKDLLIQAEKDVLYAIERIASSKEDESDLNLFNTLALIYQDLATYERRLGAAPDEVAKYLIKSDEATKRALRANPSNSYVLETAARNLLRSAPDLDDEKKISAAAQAISFIQQAFSLDTAALRREKLGVLANEALTYLRGSNASKFIEKLCAEGSSFGFMAKAWITIFESSSRRSLSESMEEIEPKVAKQALAILDEATTREWPLVRLMYDLQVATAPTSFEKQLMLLEELASFPGYAISLQHQLERAVLLHQRGRHKDANRLYADVRGEAKRSGTMLYLPTRLYWLYTPDGTTKLICNAQFVDHGEGRAFATVREVPGIRIPLRPQEFGKQAFARYERFRCYVSFSAMGPFLKPTDSVKK